MALNNATLVCFGEVLWDLLPTGKVAGGAPMNVAYHANTFGLQAKMVSRIGADELGGELRLFLDGKGVSADLLQVDRALPTGVVKVSLDAAGTASYEIVQPAAWDAIQPFDRALDAVRNADLLVFGSLACRSETTKNTLLQLLELAPLRVFDVNLRTPFYSKELLAELLPKANIVKMNDEELDVIGGWFGAAGSEEEKMEFLKNCFRLEALLVTRGARGAVLLNDSGLFTQTGFPVKVQDTIGSGDAFLGAFLSKMTAGATEDECLETACAAGAFVATKKGATPKYSPEEVFESFSKEAVAV